MNFNEAVKLYQSDPAPAGLDRAAAALLGEMTLREKLHTLRGHAMGVTVKNTLTRGRYYNGEAYPAGGCRRLGIPAVRFTDGPRGIVMGHSTCFPVSMLRGASFDPDLEYRIGNAMAKEAIAGGANLYAGVCINLLRSPLWGRAQETYGEDPFLLGQMGAALTRAMQENGVIACVKHYALNSIEDLRFSVNAVCSDRTLYDVYLPHFKKCLEAGAMSVMAAYNRVNGEYCCEHKRLLTDILRDEWGFAGFTMSDFVFGIYNGPNALNAGLDMEMPYVLRYAGLGAALKKGKISLRTVDTAVKRILRALISTVPKQPKIGKEAILCKEHIALAREAAAKGTVLLKNENDALPLKEGAKLAVIGRYANKPNVGDHGSSRVYSPYTVTPFEGIKNRFGAENVTLYNGCDPAKAAAAAETAEYLIVCVGSDWLQEGEFLVNMGEVKEKPKGSGGDRKDLRIPPEDAALIRALANTGKKLIVNIMGGSAYVIKEWSDLASGILMSFYSGLEGGNALADILSGDVNPAGRLPFTVAQNEADYPFFLHLGGTQKDILYDYYHGYTLFDKTEKPVQFPFGFGLSYTTFEITAAAAEQTETGARVKIKVKNTGAKDGDTVLQVYASSEGAQTDRPVKLLKGFARVHVPAGETLETAVDIALEDLKFYDPDTKTRLLDPTYRFTVTQDGLDFAQAGTLRFVD